jgi:hypothetical protein
MAQNIPKMATKYTKMVTKYIYQIAMKIPNGHEVGNPKFIIPRPSKIYQNWHFWYENIPSGIPDRDRFAILGMSILNK